MDNFRIITNISVAERYRCFNLQCIFRGFAVFVKFLHPWILCNMPVLLKSVQTIMTSQLIFNHHNISCKTSTAGDKSSKFRQIDRCCANGNHCVSEALSRSPLHQVGDLHTLRVSVLSFVLYFHNMEFIRLQRKLPLTLPRDSVPIPSGTSLVLEYCRDSCDTMTQTKTSCKHPFVHSRPLCTFGKTINVATCTRFVSVPRQVQNNSNSNSSYQKVHITKFIRRQ